MNPSLRALGAVIGRLLRRLNPKKLLGILLVFLFLLFLVTWGFVSALVNFGESATAGSLSGMKWWGSLTLVLGLVFGIMVSLILVVDEIRNYYRGIFAILGIMGATGLLWWKIGPLFLGHPTLSTIAGAGLLVGGMAGAFLVFSITSQWLKTLMTVGIGLFVVAFIGLSWMKSHDELAKRGIIGGARASHIVYIYDDELPLEEGESSEVYDTEPPETSPVSWQTELFTVSGCLIWTINGSDSEKHCGGAVSGKEAPLSVQVRAVDGPAVYRIRVRELE